VDVMGKEQFYIGIDRHRYVHRTLFMDTDGSGLNSFSFGNTHAGCLEFIKRVKKAKMFLKKTPVIGVEGHNGNLKLLQDYLSKDGLEIIFKPIEPIKIKRHKDVLGQPKKSDDYDAYVIADFLRTREQQIRQLVPVNSNISKLKVLSRYYETLTKEHNQQVNRLHQTLSEYFPEYNTEKLFSKLTTKTSLQLLYDYPSPELISNLSVKKLANFLNKYSKGHLGISKAEQILNVVKKIPSLSEKYSANIIKVKSMAKILITLSGELKMIENEIKSILKEIPQAKILKSFKGAGDILIAKLLSETDAFANFKDDSNVAFYIGIAPLLDQSGKRKRYKRAYRVNHHAKDAIIKIAMCSAIHSKESKTFLERKIKEGKSYWEAIRALARSLIRVFFAMIKNNSYFQENYNSNSLEKNKETA
jgi:transposase